MTALLLVPLSASPLRITRDARLDEMQVLSEATVASAPARPPFSQRARPPRPPRASSSRRLAPHQRALPSQVIMQQPKIQPPPTSPIPDSPDTASHPGVEEDIAGACDAGKNFEMKPA